MLLALIAVFLLFSLVDAFLSAAVIYHLWKYTLPGWSAAKIIVPLYCTLTLIFFGFALYSLSLIAAELR